MSTEATGQSRVGRGISVALALGLVLTGCRTRLYEPVELRCGQVQPGARPHPIDLLFVVDDSGSMGPMQAELMARVPDMLSVFDDKAAFGVLVDLHIGVVTTTYGAGLSPSDRCDDSAHRTHGRLQ